MPPFPSISRWMTRSAWLVLGVLVLTEGTARIAFRRSLEGRFLYGFSQTAGFDESRKGEIRLQRSGARRFFPQSYPRERPVGVLRVMVVGDSVPRGAGVQASYAGQLGALLRKDGVECETWNLGVPGYGARRIQKVISQALHYQPSLMVLHLNDSNEYEDERELRRSQDYQGWHPRNWLMKSVAFRRLHEAKTERVAWEWLPEAVRARDGIHDADAEVASSLNEEKLREWESRVEQTTRETLEMCRKAGVPVLLVIQAKRETDAAGNHSLTSGNLEALAQRVAGNSARLLSMRSVFEGQPLAVATEFADGSHLRPAGHQRLAEAIHLVIRNDHPGVSKAP